MEKRIRRYGSKERKNKKEYYIKNRDSILSKRRDRYNKNKEYHKTYYIEHENYIKNRLKLWGINYRKMNKELINKKRRLRGKGERLKYNHGISLEEYNNISIAQGGACAICGRVENFGGSGKCLVVDHDHISGKNRGLLCTNCNNGMGKLQDSIKILEMAIKYLKLHR